MGSALVEPIGLIGAKGPKEAIEVIGPMGAYRIGPQGPGRHLGREGWGVVGPTGTICRSWRAPADRRPPRGMRGGLPCRREKSRGSVGKNRMKNPYRALNVSSDLRQHESIPGDQSGLMPRRQQAYRSSRQKVPGSRGRGSSSPAEKIQGNTGYTSVDLSGVLCLYCCQGVGGPGSAPTAAPRQRNRMNQRRWA